MDTKRLIELLIEKLEKWYTKTNLYVDHTDEIILQAYNPDTWVWGILMTQEQ